MLLFASWLWVVGRFGAAALSAGSAFMAWFGWRMSGDLDPFWLDLANDHLAVQMRRRRETLLLRNPSARRLDGEEIEHLGELMSTAGLVFSSGSFDSHRLGVCDLFATDLEHAVLLEVDNPEEEGERLRWIVTPDEPAAFLTALRAGGSGAG